MTNVATVGSIIIKLLKLVSKIFGFAFEEGQNFPLWNVSFNLVFGKFNTREDVILFAIVMNHGFDLAHVLLKILEINKMAAE